jgi:hypothetical protein
MNDQPEKLQFNIDGSIKENSQPIDAAQEKKYLDDLAVEINQWCEEILNASN